LFFAFSDAIETGNILVGKQKKENGKNDLIFFLTQFQVVP